MQAARKWSRPGVAANASTGEAFAVNAAAAVAHIRANASGAAAGRDPEYLHQLRVGIRRLRSTLRAFRGLIRRKRALGFDRELRSAQRTLGAARDWDVFYGAHRHAGLRRAARRSAAATRQRARAMVSSALFRALPVQVLAWAQAAPWRASADPRKRMVRFAKSPLDRLQRSLLEAGGAIDWLDAPRRHRVRIRVKRLRYGCECFAAAWPEHAMRPFMKRLHRLQERLGEMNDVDVQRRLLRSLARCGSSAAQIGAVHAALDARERKLMPALRRAWIRFESIKPFWR